MPQDAFNLASDHDPVAKKPRTNDEKVEFEQSGSQLISAAPDVLSEVSCLVNRTLEKANGYEGSSESDIPCYQTNRYPDEHQHTIC
jgi:hypothetical protein